MLNKLTRAFREVPGARTMHQRLRGGIQDARLRSKDPEAIFTSIYRKNGWIGNESLSSPGSETDQVSSVCEQLPDLLEVPSHVGS